MKQEITIIILMGVAGVGKTTVGEILAEELSWVFYDGDDFHPQSNIDKMKEGIPLTDEDRQPWLDALRKLIGDHLRQGKQAVISCSALKQSYRDYLVDGYEGIKLVYLKGNPGLIRARLKERLGHFMKVDLLLSQFETLEEPEDVLTIDASESPENIARQIRKELSLK